MPEISRFFGIIIAMFVKEHNPPHFHAYYNEYEVQVEIKTGIIMNGKLPKTAQRLVEEWRSKHLNEFLDNWNIGRTTGNFLKIEPLE